VFVLFPPETYSPPLLFRSAAISPSNRLPSPRHHLSPNRSLPPVSQSFLAHLSAKSRTRPSPRSLLVFPSPPPQGRPLKSPQTGVRHQCQAGTMSLPSFPPLPLLLRQAPSFPTRPLLALIWALSSVRLRLEIQSLMSQLPLSTPFSLLFPSARVALNFLCSRPQVLTLSKMIRSWAFQGAVPLLFLLKLLKEF